MTAPERPATLSDRVAGEILAWCGRLRIRQSDLAHRLGESDQWLSKRLRNHVPMSINDLARIAHALGVHATDLIPDDPTDHDRPTPRPARPARRSGPRSKVTRCPDPDRATQPR